MLPLPVIYKLGDYVKYHVDKQVTVIGRVRGIALRDRQLIAKVERLVPYSALPHYLQSLEPEQQTSRRLYLIDGGCRIVEPINFCGTVKVWLQDLPKPDMYNYEVGEILYRFGGEWKLRPVTQRHRLPCEYMAVPQHPTLPIKKVFLDLYYDDFGTFRNVYHSLGGVYMQVGNMPLKMRAQIRNHFLIGFVPFGATFEGFIRPLVQDFKRLERGVEMETVNGRVLVVASLASVTADLPQGNDLAGVKRHSAKHGCRACDVLRDKLTDHDYDHIANAHFHHLTDDLFAELGRQVTESGRERMATQYGLSRAPRPLDALQRDRHRHTPHDAYHSMGGKVSRLLDATFQLLSTAGEAAWLWHWKAIEKPPGWSRLPNPISHRGSFQFSDGLRLAMIMPFVLSRSLSPSHLKTDRLAAIKSRLGLMRDDQVCKELVQLWAVEAKALRLAFQTTFRKGDYDLLHVALEEERSALLLVSIKLTSRMYCKLHSSDNTIICV